MRKKVMAFGAFDGIHLGHIYYLKRAKKYGELIVSIARDRSNWRPRTNYGFSEKERKKLVEEFKIANKVVLGGIKSAFDGIKKVNPDFIVITPFHHVDPKVLQLDLARHGLSAKVAVIPIFKPKTYKKYFEFDIKKLPSKMKLKIKKSF